MLKICCLITVHATFFTWWRRGEDILRILILMCLLQLREDLLRLMHIRLLLLLILLFDFIVWAIMLGQRRWCLLLIKLFRHITVCILYNHAFMSRIHWTSYFTFQVFFHHHRCCVLHRHWLAYQLWLLSLLFDFYHRACISISDWSIDSLCNKSIHSKD
jgi:hypothetical protein